MNARRALKRLRVLAAPAKTSLVVGTILSIVNRTFTNGSPTRVAINYLVPFLVSAYSRYALLRELDSAREERRVNTPKSLPGEKD